MEPTRLERIAVALLASDYVKMAFLEPGELAAMARLIELELDTVADMDRAAASAYKETSKP